MSLAVLLAAGFTPDLAIEAVTLLHKVISTLEIIQDNGGEIVLAFTASPETHDALCAFEAFDDREPEGLDEDDARELSRAVAPALPPETSIRPAPRVDVVAPAGARWLVPPVPAGSPTPRTPPATVAEGLALHVSAFVAGAGRVPRDAADWYRLQGSGRGGRASPALPPPVRVPIMGVCAA